MKQKKVKTHKEADIVQVGAEKDLHVAQLPLTGRNFLEDLLKKMIKKDKTKGVL